MAEVVLHQKPNPRKMIDVSFFINSQDMNDLQLVAMSVVSINELGEQSSKHLTIRFSPNLVEIKGEASAGESIKASFSR